MIKTSKQTFTCNKCGAHYHRWHGKCSFCNSWNTVKEIHVSTSHAVVCNEYLDGYSDNTDFSKIQKLSNINSKVLSRFSTGFLELDRVLGGGIVPGSAILIGGAPGTGKSTLLLQTLCKLSEKIKILYVTGEESLQQVATRARRLSLSNENIDMLSSINIKKICMIAEKEQTKLMVIDSIQVMYMEDFHSSPGSITQVRESASYLTRFSKIKNIAIIMVGHVTKDGSLAGPKILEHCIDCSLLLEGEPDSRFRILRSRKNRFGALNELGVFAMTEQGLREVSNPSSIFLNRGYEASSGSAIVVVREGSRPLLVEIQALVDRSITTNPRRIVVGLDQNRLVMLLAALHRHGGIQMINKDVFVNVVGGIKVMETGADLALLLAMVSSLQNKSLPNDLVSFGEVGLAGEIRPVPNGQERISEATKHGFRHAIVPVANVPKKTPKGIEVFGVKKIVDVLNIFDNFK